MHIDKNKDDFNLDSFDEDPDFENLFDESAPPQIPEPPANIPHVTGPDITDDLIFGDKISPENPDIIDAPFNQKTIKSQQKKRTISDFEPDMDALLLTAQSSMIIEGMENYDNKDFTSEKFQVYIEALKGVDLYIKILNRNPGNYRKLKTLIDADTDCQQVEKIAFDLYHKKYDTSPDTDREKLEAFEIFKQIFRQSLNKASISRSMKIVKKYFLLSGSVDLDKLQQLIDEESLEIKKDITNFQQHLKLALELLKKGDSEIARGLKGRDVNVYITKTSELLGHYYKLIHNEKVSDYFFRIHNIYKKYFIMK